MKRYFIFDMDGTLCESMAYWRSETARVADYRNPVLMRDAYDRMRRHYAEDIVLKDGARELLEAAHRAGIRCCIASATARDVSQPFLDKTNLMDYMDFYIDCHEIGVFKEQPDIYLEAARRLGARVSECAVFEDSEYCAHTAKDAGFFVVGVYDPVTSGDGDIRQYSDIYIERLADFSVTE